MPGDYFAGAMQARPGAETSLEATMSGRGDVMPPKLFDRTKRPGNVAGFGGMTKTKFQNSDFDIIDE